MKKVNVEHWHLVASVRLGQWQLEDFEHKLEAFNISGEIRAIVHIRNIGVAPKGTFTAFPHPSLVGDMTFVGKDFELLEEENVPFSSTDKSTVEGIIRSLTGGSLLYVRPEVDLKKELTKVMKGLLK